jgi:hypothetical protein
MAWGHLCRRMGNAERAPLVAALSPASRLAPSEWPFTQYEAGVGGVLANPRGSGLLLVSSKKRE